MGASLSVAASAHYRRVCARRRDRHRGAADGAMAVGAVRPAVRHRKPSGCQHQYRDRSSRERAAGRPHAPHGEPVQRGQRDAYDKLNFVFLRDIAPVAGITRVANVMVVNLSVPARTVPEFIAYAKANPDRINMASGGTGSSNHISGELFKMMADVKMVHVPYRGGSPALADLMGGQVQVLFIAVPSSIEYIKAGQLRALAVTTATRSDALPGLPTIGDFVPGYEESNWWGFGAPRNTPPAIVDRLNQEINAALADPRIKARLAELGGTVLAGSPADFGKLIADETEKLGGVVKFANIKPE